MIWNTPPPLKVVVPVPFIKPPVQISPLRVNAPEPLTVPDENPRRCMVALLLTVMFPPNNEMDDRSAPHEAFVAKLPLIVVTPSRMNKPGSAKELPLNVALLRCCQELLLALTAVLIVPELFTNSEST